MLRDFLLDIEKRDDNSNDVQVDIIIILVFQLDMLVSCCWMSKMS